MYILGSNIASVASYGMYELYGNGNSVPLIRVKGERKDAQ